MKDVVTANDFRLGIRKQWERVAELLRLPAINIRRIDADADNENTACIEIRKPFLETPQLGVAKQSPKSAIKNHHDRFRSRRSREQIAQANRFSILIQ